jgi:hypothetical protein
MKIHFSCTKYIYYSIQKNNKQIWFNAMWNNHQTNLVKQKLDYLVYYNGIKLSQRYHVVEFSSHGAYTTQPALSLAKCS